MKLNKIPKSELELLSYTEIAKMYLKENKVTKNTADLFKEVCNLLELSENERLENKKNESTRNNLPEIRKMQSSRINLPTKASTFLKYFGECLEKAKETFIIQQKAFSLFKIPYLYGI